MKLDRRGFIAATPAAFVATSVAAQGAQAEAHAARQRIAISTLFERLRDAPRRLRLDDMFSDTVTFLDLNNASFGEVTGKAAVTARLRQMHQSGDLNLIDQPMNHNVIITPDWAVYATARPAFGEGLFGISNRPIAFGFQFWEVPKISILTVMRPFEPSFTITRDPLSKR